MSRPPSVDAAAPNGAGPNAGHRPDEPDPKSYLRGMARFFRAIAERAAPGWQLYRVAAAVQPEVRADQVEPSRLRRLTATELFSVVPNIALRAEMTRDDAVDTLLVNMGPESCDLLVRQVGYSLDRFGQWIAGTLIASLLEPDHGWSWTRT